MKEFNLTVLFLLIYSIGFSQSPIKFDLEGKVTDNGVGIYGVNISVFENKELKYSDPKPCFSINAKGEFSCPLNYLQGFGESRIYHMVFEHPDYITKVCDVEVKKGDKIVLVPEVEMIKSTNASHQSTVQLIVYDTMDLSKRSQQTLEIKRGKNLLYSVEEMGKVDTSLLTNTGELWKAQGVWLKLVYTEDLTNFDTKFIFYNKSKHYEDSYQCFQAYLQPVQVCNLYEELQLAKLNKPSSLQIDSTNHCKVVNVKIDEGNKHYLEVMHKGKSYYVVDDRKRLALNAIERCQKGVNSRGKR